MQRGKQTTQPEDQVVPPDAGAKYTSPWRTKKGRDEELVKAVKERDAAVSSSVAKVLEAYAGPGSQFDRLPRVHSANPFAPGLHLMYGPARAGKTVTLLAMVLELRKLGYAATYQNIMEPRGLYLPIDVTEEEKAQAVTGGDQKKANVDVNKKTTIKDAERLKDYLTQQSYSDWLWDRLESMPKDTLGPLSWKTGNQSFNCTPVMALDSLTYLIRALPETQMQAKVLGNTTFKGGLAVADTIGMMHHQLRAEYTGVAVVAAINQDLFPVVEDLGGAVEGLIETRQDGSISITTRALSRETIEIHLDQDHVAAARKLLRYTAHRTVRPSTYAIQS
jgi:hypothetical protein